VTDAADNPTSRVRQLETASHFFAKAGSLTCTSSSFCTVNVMFAPSPT
jgi:hypothetical protein